MSSVIQKKNAQTIDHTVDYIHVTDNLVALRCRSVVSERDGSDNVTVISDKAFEAVYPLDAVDALLKGKNYIPEKQVELMTNHLLSIYQREGFLHPTEIIAVPKSFKATKEDLLALNSPFEAMKQGLSVTPVHVYYDGHTLFHPEKDEVYPIGIRLDYIEGHMSNGKYDLDVALKHLKARDDVQVHGNKIKDIPRYNRSSRHSQFLAVTYMPDHEMANKIWQVSKKLDPKYPTTSYDDAIDVLDAMGLIEAGAMLPSAIKEVETLKQYAERESSDTDDGIEDDDEIQEID